MTRCEATGKLTYPTRKAANAALTKLLRYRASRGQIDRMELRAYACGRCDGWHTTSMVWGGK